MKICGRHDCTEKNPQPFENFDKSSDRKDGYACYCKTCSSRLQKERRQKNRKKTSLQNRNEYLKSSYGLTLKTYNEVLEKQNFSCAICKVRALALDKNLQVDVDPSTGEIRGLLCSGCKTVVNNCREDIRILNATTRYLRRLTCEMS